MPAGVPAPQKNPQAPPPLALSPTRGRGRGGGEQRGHPPASSLRGKRDLGSLREFYLTSILNPINQKHEQKRKKLQRGDPDSQARNAPVARRHGVPETLAQG